MVKPWELPSHYFGTRWDGWLVGLGQNRDADYITRSNFQVFLDKVKQASANLSINHPSYGINGGPIDIDSVQVVREGHWLCGWVEWIAIHPSDTAAVEVANELIAKCDAYPILDEEHADALAEKEINEYWRTLSIGDRYDICNKAGVSIFAARHKDVPDYTIINFLKDTWV